MKSLQFVVGIFGFRHTQNKRPPRRISQLAKRTKRKRIRTPIVIFTANARLSCFAHGNTQQRDWGRRIGRLPIPPR